MYWLGKVRLEFRVVDPQVKNIVWVHVLWKLKISTFAFEKNNTSCLSFYNWNVRQTVIVMKIKTYLEGI